ncbi:MAG: hypothetical protein ACTH9H_12940, partial [Galactobacter sp.]
MKPISGESAYCKTPEDSFRRRSARQGTCLVWTGAKDEKGYGHIYVGGRAKRAHRYAYERENGPVP